jgi:hypothetical protein
LGVLTATIVVKSTYNLPMTIFRIGTLSSQETVKCTIKDENGNFYNSDGTIKGKSHIFSGITQYAYFKADEVGEINIEFENPENIVNIGSGGNDWNPINSTLTTVNNSNATGYILFLNSKDFYLLKNLIRIHTNTGIRIDKSSDFKKLINLNVLIPSRIDMVGHDTIWDINESLDTLKITNFKPNPASQYGGYIPSQMLLGDVDTQPNWYLFNIDLIGLAASDSFDFDYNISGNIKLTPNSVNTLELSDKLNTKQIDNLLKAIALSNITKTVNTRILLYGVRTAASNDAVMAIKEKVLDPAVNFIINNVSNPPLI